MSDTNRVSLKFSPEVTAGVLSSNEFVTLPFTGTSDMGATPEMVVSDLIRSDRQVSNLRKVDQSVGGGFDTELIPGAFDTLLEGVMQSSFTAESEIVSVGDSLRIIESGVNIFIQVTLGQFNGTLAGDVLRVNDGTKDYFCTVQVTSSPSAVVVTCHDLPVTAGYVTTHTVHLPGKLVNGVTPKSFSVERGFEDANVYEYLTGMEMDTFSVSASANSLVTASFGMLGRSQLSKVGRQAGITDVTEETYGDTFNASSNLATIGESSIQNPGVLAADLAIVTEISLEITNNLRELNALGTVGAASIGSGEFSVTGSMSVYFEDDALLEKLLENTQTTLRFGFAAEDGSMISFFLPAIKFTEGIPEVSGKNEDVMLNLGFQAFAAGGIGSTIRVQRFAASA
jgi:hypothetical protein